MNNMELKKTTEERLRSLVEQGYTYEFEQEEVFMEGGWKVKTFLYIDKQGGYETFPGLAHVRIDDPEYGTNPLQAASTISLGRAIGASGKVDFDISVKEEMTQVKKKEWNQPKVIGGQKLVAAANKEPEPSPVEQKIKVSEATEWANEQVKKQDAQRKADFAKLDETRVEEVLPKEIVGESAIPPSGPIEDAPKEIVEDSKQKLYSIEDFSSIKSPEALDIAADMGLNPKMFPGKNTSMKIGRMVVAKQEDRLDEYLKNMLIEKGKENESKGMAYDADLVPEMVEKYDVAKHFLKAQIVEEIPKEEVQKEATEEAPINPFEADFDNPNIKNVKDMLSGWKDVPNGTKRDNAQMLTLVTHQLTNVYGIDMATQTKKYLEFSEERGIEQTTWFDVLASGNVSTLEAFLIYLLNDKK